MPLSATLRRRFLRLSAVNILSNLTVPLVGVVDTVMLGHLPQLEFLAGVVLASLIFDYLYFGLGFLRMGTTGLTAQAVGAGDRREVANWLFRALLLGFALGTLALLCAPWIERLGFALLSGEPAVEQAGREYFRARIWGAPATLGNLVLAGWFLGRQQVGRLLALTLTTNLANVAGNYLLIVILGWAARGAGLATTAGQYAGLLLGTALVAVSGTPREWRSGEVFDRHAITRLLRLNLDIFVRTLCLVSAFAVFTNFSSLLGGLTLTANAILLRLLSVASYLIDGAAFAAESLAGALFSRRDRDALSALLRFSQLTGMVLSLAVVVPTLAAPRWVLGLFTSHLEVVALAEAHVPWLSAVVVLGSLAYIFDGYFLGLTAGRILRNSMLISAGLFLPLALWALSRESNHLLWLSFALLMALRAATLGWAARRLAVAVGSG